jgi:hypothetical protein
LESVQGAEDRQDRCGLAEHPFAELGAQLGHLLAQISAELGDFAAELGAQLAHFGTQIGTELIDARIQPVDIGLRGDLGAESIV